MSGYLLCQSPLAQHPYSMRDMRIMLYSAEELCYYICHYYYLIEEDFFCDELFDFIGIELGLKTEADYLKKLKEAHQGLVPMLLALLRQFHYYNEVEIKEFTLGLEEFRHFHPAKRRAMKADFLMENGHYLAAIQIYHLFDDEKKDESLGSEFYMNVKQHMAAGYVRLGLFEEAHNAYLEAFLEGQSEELLKQMYQFSLFTGMKLTGKVYNTIKPEWEALWRQEYEEVAAQGSLLATTGPTAAMFTKDSIKRAEAIGKYIDGIKKNYRSAIM